MVPNHLADESQTRQPDTLPDHSQKSMADGARSPVLRLSSTGSKFPIGDGEMIAVHATVSKVIQFESLYNEVTDADGTSY